MIDKHSLESIYTTLNNLLLFKLYLLSVLEPLILLKLHLVRLVVDLSYN